MSKDSKFVTRPKVRFSQIPDDEEQGENAKGSENQGPSKGKLNKPRIQSVMILDKPVTLVRENKPTADNSRYKQLAHVNSTEGQEENEEEEVQCLIEQFATLPKIHVDSNAIQSQDLGKEQVALHNARSMHNIDTNSPVPVPIESDDSCDTNTSPQVPPLDLSIFQDERRVKKQKPKYTEHIHNPKNPGGKENSKLPANAKSKSISVTKKKLSSVKCIPSPKEKVQTTDKVTKYKTGATEMKKVGKPGLTTVNSKNHGIKPLSKTHTAPAARSHSTAKPAIPTLMPCHKYNMLSSKAKSSTVKKRVIYNVTGPKIKPYVGPGVLKSSARTNAMPKQEKKPLLKSHDFSKRLSKPEYNSIMCTVNKLEEVKDEKIVTDIEHLPNPYRTAIHEKVSTALDFPLNKAIYKNLVDLSIDEKQLPCRLMRSKDPEPRQKDIVPVLSDFFTPEITEEYCTSVSVRPCIPENTDNWNPYKISDKILEWKASIDYVE